MQPRELAIRRTLGIPDTAVRTLILEPSAHLDWDWQDTFEQYYQGDGPAAHQAVSLTFRQMIKYVKAYRHEPTPYPYTICEMSYVQQFLTEFPDQATVLEGFGSLLQISGGGFVSADNLLSHPEAFIRNYLLGQIWMAAAIGAHVTPNLWIPDDFGHDTQLPALAEAMGFTGVAFWRIPGDINSPPCTNCANPAPTSPCAILSQQGVDFTWTASDGSSVQAHWLYGGYCQGNNVLGSPPTPTASGLAQLVAADPVTASSYFFVPIDCDFTEPYSGELVTIVNDWNASHTASGDTYVCLSSFNHFMDLVRASEVTLPTFALTMNPYYMGAYGSRMALKALHYQATRALIQAEALAVLLDALAASQSSFASASQQANAAIAAAWTDLIPSTHHDYVTGTATDLVFQQEQLPRASGAAEAANTVLYTLQTTIAGAVGLQQPWTGDAAIVFNATSVSRTGVLAELLLVPSVTPLSASASPSSLLWGPVQLSADQTLLFLADAPALGYAATYFSDETPFETNLSYTEQDGGFTLQNAMLSATIDAAGALTSVVDITTGAKLLSAGNVVRFYQDGGNIYRFGCEINSMASQSGTWELSPLAVTWQAPQLIETGPVRLRVIVQGSVDVDGTSIAFTQEYRLVVGESYLRILTTGTAPSGYTVMLAFSFNTQIASLQHGTTAHWADDAPRAEFVTNTCQVPENPLTVEATHEYVLPVDAAGAIIAGMYHTSTPGWAIDNADASTLLACILRNTPSDQCNAAAGSDADAHMAEYALRVPSGLAGPTSAQPLCEALGFILPQVAYPATTAPDADPPLLASLSIAVADEDSPASVTSVKAGSVSPDNVIVRTYQPTNSAEPVTFTVTVADIIAQRFQSDGTLSVVPCTALEVQTSSTALPATADTFTVTASRAISTVAIVSPGA